MNIGSVKLAKYAKATAVTVYLMTGVKATVRPIFNLTDKKADEKSRKFSAVNELLYQIVCLGMAAALIPIFERGGFKMAQKRLAKIHPGINKLSDIKGFENIQKLKDLKKAYLDKTLLDGKYVQKISDLKAAIKDKKAISEADEKLLKNDEALHFVNGGVEAGSFLASILGLTIIAPKLGHEILHPIMAKLGLNDDKEKEVGNPMDIYVVDAKAPNDSDKKVNVTA